MNIKRIKSDQYGIEAELLDESTVHAVRFYDGERMVKIGLPISYYKGELEEIAKKSVDSYFEQKSIDDGTRGPVLHNWYLKLHPSEEGECLIAHGIVTGHPRLQDSIDIHTSRVKDFYVDEAAGDMVVRTENTVYRCPLAYCRFQKQEENRDVFPDFEEIREKYENTAPKPEIEPGNVLLVLADFCRYYFHSLYYRKEGKNDAQEYYGYPHVGTFQDSFLIETKRDEINLYEIEQMSEEEIEQRIAQEEEDRIDIRYFPHYQNIEFYSECTGNKPFFIENIGTSKLFAKTSVGTIELNPGERKQVIKENVMSDEVFLAGGDLYPAGFFDEGGEVF